MRIALLGQKGIPTRQGGIERHVEELATRLAKKRNTDVYVYTRPHVTGSSRSTHKGVKLVATPSIKTKNLETITHTLTSTLHAIFRLRPDVYHYHGVGPATLAWIPRVFAPRASVLTTFHCQDRFHNKWGAFARLYLRFGEWAACKFPHQTIAVSRGLQHLCAKEYNAQARFIPNGVAVLPTRRTDRIKMLGFTRQGYILSVSRLVALKRTKDIIRAYQNMKTNLPLVIVGDSSYSDGHVEELKTLAAGNENIHFVGVQTGETLAQLIRNARLFVTASSTEGLPIALLEALVAGLPVVASSIPEHKEVLGEAGRIYTTGRVRDLTQAMKDEIIAARTKKAVDIRKRTQRRVAREYDWDRISDETIHAYESIQDRKIATKSTSKSQPQAHAA